ncbi:hypothetical protein F2Q69_00014236 [Brassica cretica]|uniref:Uncharacterized protein n=1 Tax=Brassica cretica TaxID=69181 RepID=A0A8S9QVH1_BRACR|nr:hypothetical protein F2Q69_00014236 [Brassica cretica]
MKLSLCFSAWEVGRLSGESFRSNPWLVLAVKVLADVLMVSAGFLGSGGSSFAGESFLWLRWRSHVASSYFLGVEFGLALVSYLMGFIDASLHCVHFCVPERLCPSVEDSKV